VTSWGRRTVGRWWHAGCWLAAAALLLADVATGQDATDRRIVYPESTRESVVEDYHGQPVADPYRWLEDTESPTTRDWIERQNALTFGYLKSIPQRAAIEQRLTDVWNFERYDLPVKRGNRYFFTHNDGLQNQSVLYSMTDLEAPRAVLLDPNTLSTDGTVALASWQPSEDGRLLAYMIADGGSDWRTVRIRRVNTREDLPEELRWVKFSSIAWVPSGEGFFYSRYDEPTAGQELLGANYFQKLYYHQVGTAQSDDVLVYERSDQKEWGFHGTVTEDGRYLVIDVTRGTNPQNQIFIKDLQNHDQPVQELLTGFTAEFVFVGNDGTTFYFLTDEGAPRRRVVAIDLTSPQPPQWRELIQESSDTLERVTLLGDRFIATYLHDALSAVRLFTLDGSSVGEVSLPGLGTVEGFGGRRDADETFFSFTNYSSPRSIQRFDLKTDTSQLWRQPQIAFDSSQFVTEQVFYASRDGTRVPMLLTYKRGIKRDGTNPTLLYAYGGFNISLTPVFSPENAVWLELGGIYAVPNLRGGGEYGREWHEAGMLDRKQNVFDDFIAAAEYLIREQWTQPTKLAIRGRSNGGLLVGATMTQRPELFGACLPAVGVMDMLRFHKFTIGWAWTGEFGSSADPQQFKVLQSYSPLHNIRPGICYPATMVTTADRDDRVVPGHSFKFAAALQAAQGCDRPILIRVETRAGHGAGTPVSKRIEEAADCWAFLVQSLGMQWSTTP